jgi:nucleotide-binding universal stress UspA family protein/hemerythrin-like domain-containing protein
MTFPWGPDMYRHLLVPVDGTPLSIDTVGQAVEFASEVSAQITFFYVDEGFTPFLQSEAIPEYTITPQIYAEKSAERAKVILAKAEAAARASGVSSISVCKANDSPFEAIIEAAKQHGCDLIYMASHSRRGMRGLLGSQTEKILRYSEIPVLVVTTERRASKLNIAIAIIQDEHRALAVVLRGLQFLTVNMTKRGIPPAFELLRAMLRYIWAFPETLHHPKEDRYLFPRLRERTGELDEVIIELQRQHLEGRQLVRNIETALADLEACAPNSLSVFAETVERFATAQWHHMNMEETIILPAARKYLTDEDSTELAEAFGKNGDPLFGAETDHDFRSLFARILTLAPRDPGRQART